MINKENIALRLPGLSYYSTKCQPTFQHSMNNKIQAYPTASLRAFLPKKGEWVKYKFNTEIQIDGSYAYQGW